MERIGFFGSSFNPPHNGHIKLVNTALTYFDFDKLILMPTYIAPHKQIEEIFSPEVRYFMAGISFFSFFPEELKNFYRKEWNREKWTIFEDLYIENYKKFSNSKIILSDYEIKKKDVSYTIDTIKYLKKIYKESDFFIIIGMDEAKILEKWKDFDILKNIATFVVADRCGVDREKRFSFLKFFPFEEIDISSTILREKIKKKENVSNFIPEILNFFIENFIFSN